MYDKMYNRSEFSLNDSVRVFHACDKWAIEMCESVRVYVAEF